MPTSPIRKNTGTEIKREGVVHRLVKQSPGLPPVQSLKKSLASKKFSISAYVERIHDIQAPNLEEVPSLNSIEASPTRCPHPETAALMEARVLDAKKNGDSVGRDHTLPGQRSPGRLGVSGFRPTGSRFGQSNAIDTRDQGIRGGKRFRRHLLERFRT